LDGFHVEVPSGLTFLNSLNFGRSRKFPVDLASELTGKTHLAIAIARSCIRAGSRGRFFNTVDLVNRLEAEGRSGRQGRLADYLTRLDFIVLDELGYLPSAATSELRRRCA
jgi:hypothetical protein